MTILLLAAGLIACGQTVKADSVADLFPDGLINSRGKPVSVDSLQGKTVALYFSAHWCGPCRRFTPTLITYRNRYKDHFEVVFISSDRSAKDQLSYMTRSGMPWPALAWQSPSAAHLKEKFRISSIPALIILTANGEILTREGRRFVSEGVPAEKFKMASIEQEEYNCGRCSKTHFRPKLVFPQ